MLSKQRLRLEGGGSVRHLEANHLPLDSERSNTAPIRELLQRHGLRISLNRIKVLQALALARQEGRSIGIRGVHSALANTASELSLMSVREVLKRLEDEGVIILQDDKSYRFSRQDWMIIKPSSQ